MSDQTGAELIAAERERQIGEEGWTPEHDDSHDEGELAIAAACYALPDKTIRAHLGYARPEYGGDGAPDMWPWGGWWKPGDDRVRRLVKAGALIAAEIDRLLRAEVPA